MQSRILFIEDEPLYIKEFKPLLEGEGFEVILAMSATESEKELLAHPESYFDLVVADLNIYKNNHGVYHDPKVGLDLIETIQKKFPKLPILVVSGYLSTYQKELEILGITDFLSKTDDEVKKKLKAEAHRIIKSSKAFIEKQTNPQQIKEMLAAEMLKEQRAQENILSIPEEKQFELITELVGFKKRIENQIDKFPYAENVFLMMKFRESNKQLSDYIIRNLADHGLRCIRADNVNWNITNNILNPIAIIYCCKYGIALFDKPEKHQAYSPNVAYEMGFMHAQDKECLLLRHDSLPEMPFDLAGEIRHAYETGFEIGDIIADWIKQLGIGK